MAAINGLRVNCQTPRIFLGLNLKSLAVSAVDRQEALMNIWLVDLTQDPNLHRVANELFSQLLAGGMTEDDARHLIKQYSNMLMLAKNKLAP